MQLARRAIAGSTRDPDRFIFEGTIWIHGSWNKRIWKSYTRDTSVATSVTDCVKRPPPSGGTGVSPVKTGRNALTIPLHGRDARATRCRRIVSVAFSHSLVSEWSLRPSARWRSQPRRNHNPASVSDFTSRYSSMPYFDPSRPKPDCFTPPNGAVSEEMRPVLMPTMPHSSFSDTRQIRPTSRA
jgi:hypothetical protein